MILATGTYNIGGLTGAYYVIAIMALFVAAWWAVHKYNDRQRDKWVQQGSKEQRLSDNLEANTDAALKNTTAIEGLSVKLGDFVATADERFDGHDRRITRLEDKTFPAEPRH